MLVKGFWRLTDIAETVDTDRAELADFRRLQGHKPGEASETRTHQGGIVQRHPGGDQGLRQSGVVVGQTFFEPDPIWRFMHNQQIVQPLRKPSPDRAGGVIARPHLAIVVQT